MLPVEALSNIFEMVRAGCGPESNVRQSNHDILFLDTGGSRLTFCRTIWSSVAASAHFEKSVLEGSLPVARPGLIRIAMERAGSCVLHPRVVCTLRGGGTTETLRQGIPHVAQAIGLSRSAGIYFPKPQASSLHRRLYPSFAISGSSGVLT